MFGLYVLLFVLLASEITFVGPGVKCSASAQHPSCFSKQACILTVSASARHPHIHSNECKSDNKNIGYGGAKQLNLLYKGISITL